MTAEEFGQLMQVRPRHPDGRMRSPTALLAALEALPPFDPQDVATARQLLNTEGWEMCEQFIDSLIDEFLETYIPDA